MEFAKQADTVIGQLVKLGKTPIVTGGTGLYIRALFEGLDRLPSRNPRVREALQREWDRDGGLSLHEKLKKVDPQAAEKISSRDSLRLVRYLEIYNLTGKPASSLLKVGRPERLRYHVRAHWLQPDREWLRPRIAHRVRGMIRWGWLEEVRDLLGQGKDPRQWQNKPIGYVDLAEFLERGGDLEVILEKIIQKTWQYAKRQETFFRGLFRNPAYQRGNNTLEIIKDCQKFNPSGSSSQGWTGEAKTA